MDVHQRQAYRAAATAEGKRRREGAALAAYARAQADLRAREEALATYRRDLPTDPPPAALVRVDAWKARDANESRQHVTIAGLAKPNQSNDGQDVAFEYVSMRLAAAIGLPVPPAALARDASGQLYFVSFWVEAKPVPTVEAFARRYPRLAAGAAVFDAWIINADRHHGNILSAPPVLIDHAFAFRGWGFDTGRLWAMSSGADRRRWAERIEAVPGELIDEACASVVMEGGLSRDQAMNMAAFLRARQPRIRELAR
jgi:hypothetical protein